jgi:hypothetical protein
MLSGDVAAELAAGILLIGAVIGVVIGALASLVLRRPWKVGSALTDFLLAALVTAAVGLTLIAMPNVELEFMPLLTIVWGAAAGSVTVLHLGRFLLHSKR